MPKDIIYAKVIRCNGSVILAETLAKNQMYLFLGHIHPEYKKLKKKKLYQFKICIYLSHISNGQHDIKENVEKNHLLYYEFKGYSVYEGFVHGEIISSWPTNDRYIRYRHWIRVDCGIVNWVYSKQIEPGTFVKIRCRLDVEKMYDLDDNLIER